jgi:flagellar biosynthesis/type III secretory pathway protein FliH
MRLALRLPDLNAPPPAAAPPPPDPAVLAAAARAEGLAEGRGIGHAVGLKEGRAEQAKAQEAAIQRAVDRCAALLAEAPDAGRRVAEESAQALAEMLMQAMDLALPGALERLGPDIVARLVVPMLPAIADRPEAVLHVAPELVTPIAARLPPRAPEVVADPALAPGDARLAWRDGALVMSLEARRAAIAEVLTIAGLAPAKQSMKLEEPTP